MEHLIGQGPLSSEKLCQLLLATLRFPSPQRVLVTAAAAVGDLSRRAFKHIKPMVPQLLREVVICLCSCVVSVFYHWTNCIIIVANVIIIYFVVITPRYPL